MEDNAEDGAHDRNGAPNYEDVREVTRCAKDDKGGHTAEDTRWKGGRMRDNGLTLWREVDV
jgi:hypothetical protein